MSKFTAPRKSVPKSIFSGANQSALQGQFNKLGDYTGEHLLKVVRVSQEQTKDRKTIFAMKFEVVQSDNDNLKPGTTVDYGIMEGKFLDSFFSKVKYAVAALKGQDAITLSAEGVDWEAEMEAAWSEENPFEGTLVIARHTGFTEAKSTGKKFGNIQFSPLPADAE